jgi:hypothetical protein
MERLLPPLRLQFTIGIGQEHEIASHQLAQFPPLKPHFVCTDHCLFLKNDFTHLLTDVTRLFMFF